MSIEVGDVLTMDDPMSVPHTVVKLDGDVVWMEDYLPSSMGLAWPYQRAWIIDRLEDGTVCRMTGHELMTYRRQHGGTNEGA